MNIIKELTTDLRPHIHFTAKRNWINDPNGFSYYNGWYHLFYQYNPKGITWGNMSWGHAVSNDLVHWEEIDVAMIPDKTYDKDGVFSGSAITLNSKHYLYYTGVDLVPEGARQVQCIATSDDGIHYDKYSKNPVLKADEHGDEYDIRDPKMWIYKNHVYMIVATKKHGNGKAIVYKSKGGYSFDYLTEFTKPNTGFMWECPDLFLLDEQWSLIFSAMSVEGYSAENVAFIAPVDFSYTVNETKVYDYELLDYSPDYYAPQSMIDNLGRRIVIGWLRMEVPVNKDANWVGMMTLPREIKYGKDGYSYQVIEEVFIDKKTITKDNDYILDNNGIDSFFLDNNRSYSLKGNRAYEIKAEFSANNHFRLHNGEGNGLELNYNPKLGNVEVTRQREQKLETMLADELMLNESVLEIAGNVISSLPKDTYYSPKLQSEKVIIQVIIDQCVAEVFINNGKYVISVVYSNLSGSNEILVEHASDLDGFEIYELQE